MPDLTRLKAIIFDAYGTLLDVASIDQALAFHYGDQAATLATLWRRKQLEYTWLRTLMGQYRDFYDLTADALTFACRQLQLDLDQKILSDLMDHYDRLEVFPDVPAALHRLHHHFELAILSNANTDLLARAVTHNHVDQYFQAIFSVDRIRKFKPSPEVYRLPAVGLGLEINAQLFVSSNTWDVCGAKAFGLKAAWLKRGTGVLDQLGQEPDLVVNNLEELAKNLIP